MRHVLTESFKQSRGIVSISRLFYYVFFGFVLCEVLLTPTKLYVKPVLAAIEAAEVRGVSHITGGGFYENVPRCIPDGLGAKIDKAIQFNPNGSVMAVEGITSPDGRILGKMGHSERKGSGLYRNVIGEYDMKMFESAVKYFK